MIRLHVDKFVSFGAFLCFVIHLSFPGPLFSAFEERYFSAAGEAMGGTTLVIRDDPSTVFHNPSMNGEQRHLVLTTDFSRPFLLKELDTYSFAVSVPIRKFSVTGAGYSLGKSNYYRETELLLSLAGGFKTFVQGVILWGLSVKYMFLDLGTTYGSDSTGGLDVGITWKKSNKVIIALSMIDLNSPSIGCNRDNLSRSCSIGVSYIPVGSVVLNSVFDVESDGADDITNALKFGQELAITGSFLLRAGFSSVTSGYTLGFGLRSACWRIDYAYLFHPVLPPSNILSIVFTGKSSDGENGATGK
jgi:hypothetical protein